jgi:hypothetical protein
MAAASRSCPPGPDYIMPIIYSKAVELHNPCGETMTRISGISCVKQGEDTAGTKDRPPFPP